MIDIHCHILPDLDDGPQEWQESLDMCEMAFRDGIRTIVATPHIKPGVYEPEKKLIFSRIKELNKRIEQTNWVTGPTGTVPLTILPGAEVHLQPDIISKIDDVTINPSTGHIRYFCLELPDYFLFPRVKELIQELRSKDIVPILTHPERNLTIMKNKRLLFEFIKAGVLSQVTAMSITGEFNREIQKITKKMITSNLVHIIASDAHSRDGRPPILSRAVKETAKIIGTDRAEKMVQDIPQAVIEGKEVVAVMA
ncbi:MAG: CpsB/CapC family capsule biosynthesis tyrosine phosphatase [Thermodesulfobacteriota bacterium]|nr:CpsB/CapC family capsule biosynthesis tyrosine phosphatase [Thermodesulfobacteriota bacterium]